MPGIARYAARCGSASSTAADVGNGDRRERLAADRLGQLGQRRELVDVEPGRQLLRRDLGGLLEGAQDLLHLLERPQEAAAVHLGAGVQRDLQPGDDPEVAAAAADGPEQLGVLGGAEPAAAAEAVDQLDADDAVRAEPVGAAEPADAAGDGHAGDRRVGVGPAQEGQAGALERGTQLAGLDAGADGGGTTLHVDLDPAQATGAQQQGLVERGEAAVAGRLGGHLAAVVDGPADGGDHVVGVVDLEDGHRVLRDVDHPRGAGGVPGRSAGVCSRPTTRRRRSSSAWVWLPAGTGWAGTVGRVAGMVVSDMGCSSRVDRFAFEPVTRGWATPLARLLPRTCLWFAPLPDSGRLGGLRSRRASRASERRFHGRHCSRSLSTTASRACSRARAGARRGRRTRRPGSGRPSRGGRRCRR